MVKKGNLILAKSVYVSVKNNYGSRSNYQLSKTYKSVAAFSLNNADFPTLAPLSPRKPVSDCISVSPYKSVQNSFIKPVQKPSYISSIKPFPVVVRKCSVYNSSLDARNECVHVSVNHTICKVSVTHFSECAFNVPRKVFKIVSSSLSVSTVSVPPVNVVKVTTTPTCQYTSPAPKHAIMLKPVFSTSHVNTSPAPAVVTLKSSLPLHVCDVPVSGNLCHVCKMSSPIPLSVNLTTTSRSHSLIKKFPHFHQQLMIAPRKSVFCDYNYEYKGVYLQASFSTLITLLYHVILSFQSTKTILVFNIFSIFNLITFFFFLVWALGPAHRRKYRGFIFR